MGIRRIYPLESTLNAGLAGELGLLITSDSYGYVWETSIGKCFHMLWHFRFRLAPSRFSPVAKSFSKLKWRKLITAPTVRLCGAFLIYLLVWLCFHTSQHSVAKAF